LPDEIARTVGIIGIACSQPPLFLNEIKKYDSSQQFLYKIPNRFACFIFFLFGSIGGESNIKNRFPIIGFLQVIAKVLIMQRVFVKE
jgi:hypothetical protein